jgi:hypothetical protein
LLNQKEAESEDNRDQAYQRRPNPNAQLGGESRI